MILSRWRHPLTWDTRRNARDAGANHCEDTTSQILTCLSRRISINSAFKLEWVMCINTVLSAWFAPKLPGAVTYSLSIAMSFLDMNCAMVTLQIGRKALDVILPIQ